MRQLKIALVHAFAWPDVRRGGERLVDELTTYLRGSGHVVDTFAGTTGESQFYHGDQGRDYKMRIPWSRAVGRLGLGRIEMFGVRAVTPLLVHNYDIVHTFTPTAALAAIAAGQRTVYTVIGHPTPETLPSRYLQRTALACAVRSATEVAVLGMSAAAALASAFGRVPKILPPGVSMSRCRPRLERRSGPPIVLFSGDLNNPDKGLAPLLAAFERVLTRYPDARLALSGPGSPERAISEIGSAWKTISTSVDVLGTGALEDVPARYRASHVTVLPSRNEAFGIVLVESLACGTPVVAGTPGGADDIVTSEVGRLVRYGELDALADAIAECIELSTDPSTPSACRARAETWDWSVVGRRYLDLYASVAGRRGLPGVAFLQRSQAGRASKAE